MAIQFDEEKQKKRIAQLRHKEEEEAVKRHAQKIRGRYVDLSGMAIETDALGKIPEEKARALNIAAFKIVGDDLYVAVKEPDRDDVKAQFEKLRNKGLVVIDYLASMRSLEKAWERYADITYTHGVRASFLDISEESLNTIAERVKSNDDIKALVGETLSEEGQHKITRLIEVIFGSAIATTSSDVHIEPQEKRVRLRLRQDGVLYDIAYFDHETDKKLNSRIKILAHLKLTQEIRAQDGRFTIDYRGDQIEVRVSVVPGSYGESIVMRILNPNAISVSLEKLGIEPRLFHILKKEVAKPNGLILTTGPTGSGKTTTLYAFLKKIYNPEVKIITIEDPVEYHLEGITQTQINHEKGYTFLNGLRAALRQDPDVVMVGEIRDSETAKIAVNASLTGHLVLSTLHTNNAAGAIPRLIDLGVSPKTLPSALTASLAQRLVRKLCPQCKQERKITPDEENIIQRIITNANQLGKDISSYGIHPDEKIKLYTSPGCPECNGIGYKGRIGLFEAILTDEHIEAIIYDKPGEREIRRAASKQGILTMQEDGILKALAGVTSLEEVAKVVDIEEGLGLTERSLDNTIQEIAMLATEPKTLPTAIKIDQKAQEQKPQIQTQSEVDAKSVNTKVVAPPPNLPTINSVAAKPQPQEQKKVEPETLLETPEESKDIPLKQQVDQQTDREVSPQQTKPQQEPEKKEDIKKNSEKEDEQLQLLRSLGERLDNLEKNLNSIDSGIEKKLGTLRKHVDAITKEKERSAVRKLSVRKTKDTEKESTKTTPHPSPEKRVSNEIDVLIANQKKQNTHTTHHKPHAMHSPYALDNDIRNIEIHLLVDYLKSLEEEQMLHPEVGIAKQIREVRKTVVEILKTMPRKNEMVTVGSDGKIIKSEIEQLIDQLLDLEEQQTRNPHIGTAQKLRTLRQTLEQL